MKLSGRHNYLPLSYTHDMNLSRFCPIRLGSQPKTLLVAGTQLVIKGPLSYKCNCLTWKLIFILCNKSARGFSCLEKRVTTNYVPSNIPSVKYNKNIFPLFCLPSFAFAFLSLLLSFNLTKRNVTV